MRQETVTISRAVFERMKHEIALLKGSGLYQRLLEFEENISKGKKFGRKELGF